MNQGRALQHTGVEQLIEDGFNPAQIGKLMQLRDRYPLAELVDRSQFEQLQFLKWLYERGQYPAGRVA